jgi:hypothetical protein
VYTHTQLYGKSSSNKIILIDENNEINRMGAKYFSHLYYIFGERLLCDCGMCQKDIDIRKQVIRTMVLVS